MKKTDTTGHIKDGILKIHRRAEFDQSIKQMTDGRVLVTVEKIYNKRSINQNAYYWGVVLEIYHRGLQELGWEITKSQTHEYLLNRFSLKSIVNEKTGEIIDVTVRSSEMTTTMMMEYFAAVTRSGAEDLGIKIPEPNEQISLELLDND